VAYSHPIVAPAIVNHANLPHASGRFQTMRGELMTVSWSYNAGATSTQLKVADFHRN
jgi:hypothetical protein